MDPLILTLQFDAVTDDLFNRHREALFPKELNRTPAHLTLFHALPGERIETVMVRVAEASQRAPFPVEVAHLMRLGRGVAYAVRSRELMALRSTLATEFRPFLTGQDRERFRPHVTVQNKVSPAKARATHEDLARHFAPFHATAEGLQLWHYRGGPWAPAAAVAFRAPPGPPPHRSARTTIVPDR